MEDENRMNCKLIKKHTIDFIEGNLSEDVRLAFLKHLQECPMCSKKVNQTAEVWRMLEQKDAIKAPPFFLAKVQQKIRQAESSKFSLEKMIETLQRWYMPAVSTTVLIIGLLMGHYFGGYLYQSMSVEPSMEYEQGLEIEIADEFSISGFDELQSGSLAEIYLELE